MLTNKATLVATLNWGLGKVTENIYCEFLKLFKQDGNQTHFVVLVFCLACEYIMLNQINTSYRYCDQRCLYKPLCLRNVMLTQLALASRIRCKLSIMIIGLLQCCLLCSLPHSCLRGRLLLDSRGHFVRTLLRHLSSVALEIVADHQPCLQDNRLYMARRHFVHDAHSRLQPIDSDQSAR